MKQILFIVSMLLAGVGWAMPGVPAQPPAPPLKGVLLESIDTGVYTYLRIGTGNGEKWAAVPKAAIAKGAEVTIENPITMDKFESPTLKRTFDQIFFGTLAGGASGPASPSDMVALHASQAGAADAKVSKASGPDARTVAEVLTKTSELKGSTVQVRGAVVKYAPSILGKNWIHLRDGTGSAADHTNDILVTTTETVKVGDIVTLRGAVHTDRDFGSGYSYKVLIEDATLQK